MRGRLDRAGLSLATFVIASCGTPAGEPPPVEDFIPRFTVRPHPPQPSTAQVPPRPTQPIVPVPPPPPPPPQIPTSCVKTGTVTGIAVRGVNLVACLDVDTNATPDQCVMWNRQTGQMVKIMKVDDLPDGAPEAPSDDKPEDPSDDRVTVDTSSVQVCPEDRVCVKLMPKMADAATLDSAFADSTHHNVAVLVSSGDAEGASLELWNMQTGTLRSRTKMTGDAPNDTTYTFAAKSFGDSIVLESTRGDNQLSALTLMSIDGSRKVPLAGGSKFVDADSLSILAPGVIAVLDSGPPGQPYHVYLHATASGATLGAFTVRYDDASPSDTATLLKIDATSVGVIQHAAKLQIDVLDRSGGQHTYRAPGC